MNRFVACHFAYDLSDDDLRGAERVPFGLAKKNAKTQLTVLDFANRYLPNEIAVLRHELHDLIQHFVGTMTDSDDI